eukprot:jgi/Bigna1/81384/fgenesh1_pg.80_\
MEEFKAQQELNESLHDMVDHIVDNATENLLDSFFNSRAESKTAEQVVESIYQAVAFQLLRSDPGEVKGKLNPSWEAEQEPPMCEIDRFARGVIPLRHRPGAHYRNKINIMARPGTEVVASRAASVSGNSVASRRGKYSGGGNRQNRTKNRKGKGEKRDPLQPYEITEEVGQDEIKMDRLRDIELRKMERRRKREQIEEEKKRRAIEEEERIKRLQEELQGKPYTFDQDGNVILIQSLKAEKMPRISLEPKIKVKNAPIPVKEEISPKDKKKNAKGKQKKKSKKAKGKETPANSFLEKVDAEPPIMDVIELQSGVTIRDSATGQVKAGAEPSSGDVMHMTRTEYNSMLDSMQQPVAMVQPSTADSEGMGLGFGKNPNIQETDKAPDSKRKMDADGAQDHEGGDNESELASGGGSPSSKLNVSSGFDFQDTSTSTASLGDTSKIVLRGGLTAARGGRAGRRRLRARGGRTHFVKPIQSRSPYSPESSILEDTVDDTEVDNFNQTILQDPQWGQSKPSGGKAMLRPRPIKTSGKDRARALGFQRAKLPRDRTGVSTVQKKLPPPIYPAYKGHGVVKGNLGKSSPPSKTTKKKKSKLNDLKVTKDPSQIFGGSRARR